MTFNEYSELAFKTCKKMPYREHLAHMGLGIAEEIFESIEIADQNELLREEFGDVLWYVACLRFNPETGEKLFDFSDNFFDNDDVIDENYDITAIKTVIGICKKYFAYEKGFDIQILKNKLEIIISMIYSTFEDPKIFQTILQNNIEKLQRRFPDAYSNRAAIEQSDKSN